MTTLCNSAILWLSFLRANTVIKKVERDLLLGLEVKRLKFCSMVSFFFHREIWRGHRTVVDGQGW